VQGSNVGTVTDGDGSYRLNAPENATLSFSFIGFISQSVAIGNRSVIDIVLEEDLKSLDEVIVVGYGTQKGRI
jgi:TonB-dependent starch-binding outer membrane protein SusC